MHLLLKIDGTEISQLICRTNHTNPGTKPGGTPWVYQIKILGCRKSKKINVLQPRACTNLTPTGLLQHFKQTHVCHFSTQTFPAHRTCCCAKYRGPENTNHVTNDFNSVFYQGRMPACCGPASCGPTLDTCIFDIFPRLDVRVLAMALRASRSVGACERQQSMSAISCVRNVTACNNPRL